MIFKALKLIENELNAYLNSIESTEDDQVVLGNISQYDSSQSGQGQNSLQNKIVISLINAEEEKTLKNLPNYQIVNGKSEYKNAPMYLNLYIIISSTATLYINAMTYLSRIVQFFHENNFFTVKNSTTNNTVESKYKLEEFKLIVDLYSPSFEEINFLWSTLGGKQLPSLIYKLRLIEITADTKVDSRGLIKEFEINKKHTV